MAQENVHFELVEELEAAQAAAQAAIKAAAGAGGQAGGQVGGAVEQQPRAAMRWTNVVFAFCFAACAS